jgi:hypothetical protein
MRAPANIDDLPLRIPARRYEITIAPGVLRDALQALEQGDDDPTALRALSVLVKALHEAEPGPWISRAA